MKLTTEEIKMLAESYFFQNNHYSKWFNAKDYPETYTWKKEEKPRLINRKFTF